MIVCYRRAMRLIVNPYDLRQAGDALAAALRMPVSELNLSRWAGA